MKKDAIIFIPGLGNQFIDQSFENIARRIALAFERQAKTPQSKFDVKITNESFKFGNRPKKQSPMATILRKDWKNNEDSEDNSQPVPLIDFYELEYHSSLSEDYQSPNILINTLRLIGAIFINIPNLISLFFGKQRKAKTLTEKLQVLYAIFVLTFIIVYTVILLAASLDIISNIFFKTNNGNLLTNLSIYNWLKNSTAIVIIVAIIELFQPNIKEIFTLTVIQYVGSVDYLSLGINRNILIGKLTDLVEQIAEKPDYENIHLIAYSFGTIVAIDTIFPLGRMPTERFNSLNTLVTIGCPFDLIRLVWPNYFARREGLANIPKRWLNVYSPVDIIASNFRNDNRNDEADKTIEPINIISPQQKTKPENIIYSEGLDINDFSLIKWLTLMGIRAHTMYWEKTFQSEISCFDILIPKMYENSEFLK